MSTPLKRPIIRYAYKTNRQTSYLQINHDKAIVLISNIPFLDYTVLNNLKTPLVRKDAEKNEKGIKRTKLLIHINLHHVVDSSAEYDNLLYWFSCI